MSENNTGNPLTLIRRAKDYCDMAYMVVQIHGIKEAETVLVCAKTAIEEALKELRKRSL